MAFSVVKLHSYLGLTVRTKSHRLTWYVSNQRIVNKDGRLFHENDPKELYDFDADPYENRNVVNLDEYANVKQNLFEFMEKQWTFDSINMAQ